MIGQHFLRIAYRRKPKKDSFLYRDTSKYLKDVYGDTLDLGGGPGYLYLYMNHKTYYVVQDMDYRLLSYGNVEIDRVMALAEEQVFRDGSFDNIIIHDAFHHFFDIDTSLQNIFKIVRKKVFFFEIKSEGVTGKAIILFEKLMGFPANFLDYKSLSDKIRKIKENANIEYHDMGKFRYLLKVVIDPSHIQDTSSLQ